MNPRLLAKILSHAGGIGPPGCVVSIVDQPGGLREAVEIAAVIEHRFAFYFWVSWADERQLKFPNTAPPDLVKIDWHDDVGGRCDFIPEQLEQLNTADLKELAVFTWAGLRTLNDGHIAPALYLDAVSDVHVILKQHCDRAELGEEQRHRTLTDRFGKVHHIYFHWWPKGIKAAIANLDESDRRVLVDIDLVFLRSMTVITFPNGIQFGQYQTSALGSSCLALSLRQ